MSDRKSENPNTTSGDASVDFILNHPDMNHWLKDALAAAVDRDPSAVLNDLEILSFVFRARAAHQSSRY